MCKVLLKKERKTLAFCVKMLKCHELRCWQTVCNISCRAADEAITEALLSLDCNSVCGAIGPGCRDRVQAGRLEAFENFEDGPWLVEVVVY